MSEVAPKENDLPEGWQVLPIPKVLEKLPDGKVIHQGWSPRCHKEPSESDKDWGVLKTTAIQPGFFDQVHNKRLPETLEPRPRIEVNSGDLLLTCAGPRNRCGIPCLIRSTRSRLMMSGKMYRFRADEDVILSKYLEAYLLSAKAQFEIDRMKTGGNESGLNLTHERFKKLLIPVAPIEQQKRIVAKIEELFSHIDAGIEALKKAKQLRKQYRQSVLKAAVTGELTKEWRLTNKDKLEPASQLLERILKERRQKWEEQQLEQFKAKGKMPKDDKWKEKYKSALEPSDFNIGGVPKEWCIASLDQACELFVDSPHRTPKYTESGWPALRPRDVVNGQLKLETAAVVSDEEFETQTQRHIPKSGDIVYSRELSFGWGILVPANTTVCLSQGMCIFRSHNSISSDYFISVINGPLGRAQAESIAVGAAHPHLNLGDIKSYCVPIPPALEQEVIVSIVDEKLTAIKRLDEELEQQLVKAEKNKQSILASAFSGKITNG